MNEHDEQSLPQEHVTLGQCLFAMCVHNLSCDQVYSSRICRQLFWSLFCARKSYHLSTPDQVFILLCLHFHIAIDREQKLATAQSSDEALTHWMSILELFNTEKYFEQVSGLQEEWQLLAKMTEVEDELIQNIVTFGTLSNRRNHMSADEP